MEAGSMVLLKGNYSLHRKRPKNVNVFSISRVNGAKENFNLPQHHPRTGPPYAIPIRLKSSVSVCLRRTIKCLHTPSKWSQQTRHHESLMHVSHLMDHR